MPNIKQQEKRVRTAARQRLENLRYRSTIKTLTRRLRDAVESGGDVEAAHRDLVKLVDRAATRGAIHKNAAARKKSQAAKLAATTPVEAAPAAPAKAAKAPARGRSKAKASA
jgi:small subunit ribosomal protein S20